MEPNGTPAGATEPVRPHAAGTPDGAGDPPRGDAKEQLRFERFGERTEDFVDSVEQAITQAVPKPVRHRRNPRQNTIVNVIWRALVLLVGITLIGVGILLLVLPGPGWATILLGLVVLASEYTWANRLLAPVRRRVKEGAVQVRGLPRGRRIATILGLLAISAMFMAGSWWLATNADLSGLP